MFNAQNGNASDEFVEQRLRDSPYHVLRKSCTKQIQNPPFDNLVEEKVQDGSSSEAD